MPVQQTDRPQCRGLKICSAKKIGTEGETLILTAIITSFIQSLNKRSLGVYWLAGTLLALGMKPDNEPTGRAF